MKFGIIREGKTPPDKRVVFSPQELLNFKNTFPQAKFKVESSPVRVFPDHEYSALGFEVATDMTDCDVLLGVKEVPIEQLIPNKTYLFFSHTIKKQPYNKSLLQACLEKQITLIDHETLVDKEGNRLIGFGRYAGIVGAYNAMRAFGIKYELFNIKKAEELASQKDLIQQLSRQTLPAIKIVITGKGKVGYGAKEMLTAIKLKEVSVNEFLTKEFDEPVFVHLNVEDYYRRIDEKVFSIDDFKRNPTEYISDFEKFVKVADVYIAGHFYKDGSPAILTREMLNDAYNNIKVVADVSCDINGPIACTLRASSIAEPLYGYYPRTHQEVHLNHPAAITVMAVDNLPCELPKDASEGFGKVFLEKIIPSFFNKDKEGILERATICTNGKLTKQFSYLNDYVTS